MISILVSMQITAVEPYQFDKEIGEARESKARKRHQIRFEDTDSDNGCKIFPFLGYVFLYSDENARLVI